MDQERNEVRQVEDARERVAQDVRSVAENANVVERAKERVQGRVEDAKSTVNERMRDAKEKIGAARENVQSSVQSSMRNMTSLNPTENPFGMLLAGIAVGFLIGLALPVTRFESERIRPITDDVKDRVRQAGTEVVRRGSEVIKETIEAGREAATTSLREQAREMGMSGENET